MKIRGPFAGSLVALWLVVFGVRWANAELPRTVAETSDYKATSRHADVVDFCQRLAKDSPVVRLGELGVSHEGRKLPLLILADPPIATPEAAAASGKLVVFAMGNIHAGEVDGKEALLMLARDLALAKERPLLKNLVLVFAPIFNADGNEKFGKNRPEQGGPELVGIRANAQGFDLNRDFVKLESPEVRALVRLLNTWNPAVVIDCHTTNGSYHRYTLTYEGGRNPAGDPGLITYVRDEMLPDLTGRLKKATGFESFFYGNFSNDRSRWESVDPLPRYGTHYVGLRNRIALLSESYTYASFPDRIQASKGFVQAICEYVAEHRDAIRKRLTDARKASLEAKEIVLRHKPAIVGRPVTVLGFVEEVKEGKRVPTDRPKGYELQYAGGTEVTQSVRKPAAYLIPATFGPVVENLQRHGITVEELREDIELNVEVYRIDRIEKSREFQKHQPVTVEATARKENRRIEAGTRIVRTAQPLGHLAAYLLEPMAADGLTTWNFFDAGLRQGQDFPVLRLADVPPLTTGKVRPLAESRQLDKPITFEALHAKQPPNFVGSPVSGLTWLDDGEHFLQIKESRLCKVHATTGRCEPFFDPEKLATGLATLPTIGKKQAHALATTPNPILNPQRTGILVHVENDLYYCQLDGSGAVRLTKSPGKKELATFSPDGKFVAFVSGNNLHVVDLATKTVRALTTDGGAEISNGRADWVYFEEIFNRHHGAYWWSPDSTRIAFLRFDDRPVPRFTLVESIARRPTPEVTAYPKAGDPNPIVKIGLVTVAGGDPVWADLGGYSETGRLVPRVGWMPEGKAAYAYVQDRAQTWLDVCRIDLDGKLDRLFRETTKAWVDDPGEATFLKDGSFLLPSERTGWRHLYHFTAEGKLKEAVTSGAWEVRTLHTVDEATGWLYFSGTRDGHTGLNLYRVHLDGTGLERLTAGAGDHRITVDPKSRLFIDTWSDTKTPTQVRLYNVDRTLARTLDTNPVYALEEYRRGTFERVRIKLTDGFEMEGSLLKPPDFDATKRYPVWVMTYGGPAAPTVRDVWGTGRLRDEMLAQKGYVVFRCDPRSASGQGASVTWTAYRQLGVQELKDLEAAVDWLVKHPWVDGDRIGLSGHSYGGFLTAFALTHSKKFAAGVAGAPVTDWRNYDTIYTERYMNTPQENPEGYKATSVVAAAAKLHGRLLLLHGLMDDNVHPQNSLQLVDALQRADKEFDVMIYPRSRHGLRGLHYERLMLEFMNRHLRPGE